jgi:MoxR-like ATPase
MKYVFSPSQIELFHQLRVAVYDNRGAYVFMQGPPGSGKTLFATTFAEQCSLPIFQGTGVEVTVPNQLFYKYDIAKMHAGTGAYQRTQLWNAIIESNYRQVVVLLDEFDKTPESADGALLQLMDTERCFFQDPYGESVQGNAKNLIIFLTSNGRRGFYPELMRRAMTVDFEAPDIDKFKAILKAQEAPGPEGLINYVAKLAIAIRKDIKNPEYWPTPAEANRLLTFIVNADVTSAANYEQLVQWNFSKNVGIQRWKDVMDSVSKRLGGVGKAIKTEMGHAQS